MDSLNKEYKQNINSLNLTISQLKDHNNTLINQINNYTVYHKNIYRNHYQINYRKYQIIMMKELKN